MKQTITFDVDADDELLKRVTAAEKRAFTLDKKVKELEYRLLTALAQLKALDSVKQAVRDAHWELDD